MEPKPIKNGNNYVAELPEKNKDFTSLDAWKRARKVKLFFYKEILPKLPREEKYYLGGQVKALLQIWIRVMADTMSKKGFSFIEFPGGSLSVD